MSDIQDEAYSEACEEIARVKASQARTLDLVERQTKLIATKLAEIERLKNEILQLGHRVKLSVYEHTQSEIERLRNEIVVLQRNQLYMEELLTRAADALDFSRPGAYELSKELRKAAQ
jgi:Ni,Fe-hydrogenase III large subunit